MDVPKMSFDPSVPGVIANKFTAWEPLEWSLEQWQSMLDKNSQTGDPSVRTGKLHPPFKHPQWERYTQSTVCPWSELLSPEHHQRWLDRGDWVYCDYNYIKDIFDAQTCEKFSWSGLGLKGRDGADSTLWIGTQGAHTPCHQDSYGYNLVAQLHGTKTWILFNPKQSKFLHPTRIPYEESSIWSKINFTSLASINPLKRRSDERETQNSSSKRRTTSKPDLSHPSVHTITPERKHIIGQDSLNSPLVHDQDCTENLVEGYRVVLKPGDVLYVPRNWWHFVSNNSFAISVNTWVECAEDNEARVNEALVRLQAAQLAANLSSEEKRVLLNPNEDDLDTCDIKHLADMTLELSKNCFDLAKKETLLPEVGGDWQPLKPEPLPLPHPFQAPGTESNLLKLFEINSCQSVIQAAAQQLYNSHR